MGKLEMPTKRQMTAPFQSKEALVDFLRAPRVNDGHTPIGGTEDMDLVQSATVLVLQQVLSCWLEYWLFARSRWPSTSPKTTAHMV
jgi:hypothetical protein